jgi:hypothetical protein
MMLESRLGQGTTFRIMMPKIAKGAPGMQAANPVGAGTANTESANTESDGIPQWPNWTMSSI